MEEKMIKQFYDKYLHDALTTIKEARNTNLNLSKQWYTKQYAFMDETLEFKSDLSVEFLDNCKVDVSNILDFIKIDIDNINNYRANEWTLCSHYTMELITISLQAAKVSKGSFDPTIGALTASKNSHLTDKELRAKVDYEKLVVRGSHVKFLEEGMALDFGGVIKGYVVEKALSYLKNQGSKSTYVSFGNTIAGFGSSWDVSIDVENTNELNVELQTTKKAFALSTSTYPNKHKENHLIDPCTGLPKQTQESLTLFSDTVGAALLQALTVGLFGSRYVVSHVEKYHDFNSFKMNSEGKYTLDEKNPHTVESIHIYNSSEALAS
jgi:thiamine biosynthesis lipoprotein ApbE